MGRLITNRRPPTSLITQIPEKHQRGGNCKKALQEPNRADRQANDIYPVQHITNVAQQDMPETIGFQVFGLEGLQ